MFNNLDLVEVSLQSVGKSYPFVIMTDCIEYIDFRCKYYIYVANDGEEGVKPIKNSHWMS